MNDGPRVGFRGANQAPEPALEESAARPPVWARV